jgi:RNA 3'-phosphate cyclase
MIAIDGSHGEGGGAIVRISTALSALTSNPIHIKNIRANRPRSGLAPQHLNAIKAVTELTHASSRGLEIGSKEVFFYPGTVEGGDFKVDIKTAGSITLVLQTFMLPAGFARKSVNISLKGGTDVRWSPSVDYLQNVTLPILKSVGYRMEMEMIQRGHYPRGGGRVKARIYPLKKLKPIEHLDLEINEIRGISHCVKLPEHVAERQAKSAAEALRGEGFDVDIEIEHSDQALGPGSGIVLWGEGNTRIGGSSIGEREKSAELVGREAADELLYHISRKSALDKYMGDQIIPYLAVAGNSTIKTAELTLHALTNIYVVEKITSKIFQVQGDEGEVAVIKVN